MEATDNGMMQFMPTCREVHFRTIDCVRPEIEKPFDAPHSRR